MSFTTNLIGTTTTETRRNTISFAQSKNYEVSEEFTEVSDLWFYKMAELKRLENGSDAQNKLYTQSFHLKEVMETLETWA